MLDRDIQFKFTIFVFEIRKMRKWFPGKKAFERLGEWDRR